MKRKLTPILGWSSWNEFAVNINEKVITDQIDAICDLGLDKLGYEYVNIDDGWMKRRDANGNLIVDSDKFPNGMKIIADHAHKKGIKAGIYSDAGRMTCASQAGDEKQGYNTCVGLYEHEEQDLRRFFAEWDYDFIKIDWCGGIRLGLDRKEQYSKIGKVINEIEKEIDKDIVYNICSWRFPGAWASEVADSWRTAGDITANFDSVVHQLEMVRPLAQYNGPGHVSDLDMMEIGRGMTDEEDKMHFSMWCMMSSPILLAMDLKKIRPETLAIVSNKELIDIQQDEACMMARSVCKTNNFEIWLKPLGKLNGSEKAVAIINYEEIDREFVLPDNVSLADIGFRFVSSVRDLWAHKECSLGDKFVIPAHGVLILKLCGEPEALDYSAEDKESYIYDITTEKEFNPVRPAAMMQLQKEENAVIIDVRSPEEHNENAPDGSINIAYTDVSKEFPKLVPDKSRTIVTFCQKGKRAYQAANDLSDAGYKYVYYCVVEKD